MTESHRRSSVAYLDFAELHGAFERAETTPERTLTACLERVRAFDLDTSRGAPVNAVTVMNEGAVGDAIALGGEQTGSLWGVPVWIKDSVAVEGLPTSAGCAALFPGAASADAPTVGALRRSGAVVVGKAGMTEFGNGTSPFSTMSGRIGNAYDPRNAPGGSSSGCAVAVAMGYGLAALGVDDCGSITSPAARNGCVGFRPTAGRVSTDGLFSRSGDTVPGPITRTVGDALTMTRVLEGEKSGASLPSCEGMRIGVLDSLGGNPVEGTGPSSLERKRVLASALDAFGDLGVAVEYGLSIDDFETRRGSSIEYLNSTTEALRRREMEPRTLTRLVRNGTLAPHSRPGRGLGRFLLPMTSLPAPTPNVFGRAYAQRITRNVERVRAVMNEHELTALVSLTGPWPAVFATLVRGPHLTVPTGMELPGDRPEYGSLPVGLSIFGLPGSDDVVWSLGLAFEASVEAAPLELPETPPAMEPALFSHIKRRIREESVSILHMEQGQYVRPTPEEFSRFVTELRTEGASLAHA